MNNQYVTYSNNPLTHSRFKQAAFFMLSALFLMLCTSLFAAAKPAHPKNTNAAEKKWVGTWGTARQLVEPGNMPPAPGLSNNTLRQIVCVSVGGKSLRLRVSNEFGKTPVTLKMVQIAASKGNGHIDAGTNTVLTFNNKQEVTLEPGTELFSDAVSFDLKPRMEVAITIAFGETPASLTGHPGSRTTSYLLPGQQTSPATDFTDAVKADHWYIITGIDVNNAKSPGAVAVFGDSITDGRGSGTNKQNRWPDILAMSLLKNKSTAQIGVLNMGIGGNALLKGGLGPTGLDRFEHDVFKQSGVKWIIILEGVNDIGGTRDSVIAMNVAKGLIAAYDKIITDAHSKGLKVFGATIMPFKKNGYYKPYRDAARNMVNDWIRSNGHFDAVIDFDKLLRDPNEPATLLTEAQSGANDYLHPNELGYKMMGESINQSLFK
jgi:lysophospholipase L1-like esterase